MRQGKHKSQSAVPYKTVPKNKPVPNYAMEPKTEQ